MVTTYTGHASFDYALIHLQAYIARREFFILVRMFFACNQTTSMYVPTYPRGVVEERASETNERYVALRIQSDNICVCSAITFMFSSIFHENMYLRVLCRRYP